VRQTQLKEQRDQNGDYMKVVISKIEKNSERVGYIKRSKWRQSEGRDIHDREK
jgi:hypothetical protein